MAYDEPPLAIEPCWHQLNVLFADHRAAEHGVVAHLGPTLQQAHARGLVTSWFFIRKPWWRFRYLPATTASADEASTLLRQAAIATCSAGFATRWVHGIYEPEIHAFGGQDAMAVAHELFHADSHHILGHLAVPAAAGRHDTSGRRETSMLLLAALMRAAGQDRYEQSDIWARVAEHRPTRIKAQPHQWHAFKAAVHRLMTVDTGPGTTLRTDTLAPIHDWLAAFERAGRALATLSTEGLLTRGIRAVTAHHIIFHWNRIGFSYQSQANLAMAAKECIFGESPTGTSRWPSADAPALPGHTY
jgi:thiopeptide-type bacteriocin biosynthesis protein